MRDTPSCTTSLKRGEVVLPRVGQPVAKMVEFGYGLPDTARTPGSAGKELIMRKMRGSFISTKGLREMSAKPEKTPSTTGSGIPRDVISAKLAGSETDNSPPL